jgi:phosphopantetheinyl transferase
MIFSLLPPALLALCQELFPNSSPTIAILPLPDLEQKTAILRQWLHEKEIEQLAGYHYPKRRQEWLAGRICAKQALHVFLHHSPRPPLIPDHHRCRVSSTESGQPYFEQSAEIALPLPQLSITHSKSFAAALVSTRQCGIDIQYPSENLVRVKERFCTEKEEQLTQEYLPHLPQLSRLSLLWTGKEAIKKMLSPTGIPGFHEIGLGHITAINKTEILLHFSTTNVSQTSFPVIAGLLNNGYGLAICCLESLNTTNSNPTKTNA